MNNNIENEIKDMFSNYEDYKNIIKILNKFTNTIIEELSPKLSLELSSNLDSTSRYLKDIIDKLIEENKKIKKELDELNYLLNEVSNSLFGFLAIKHAKSKILKIKKKKGVSNEKNN